MRLIYPWLLLLLTAIPVAGALWLWLHRRSRAALSRLIAPALQSKLVPSHSESRFYIQFALIITALTLLLFAAARPQWGKRQEQVFTRGRNLMIALDVSRSMLANDVHPNRLERAKTDIIDLIAELKGDRAGLIAFRYKANVICPLTTDYTFLRQALDSVSIDSAPRGATDLGDAIIKALDSLEHALDEHNAILLISDGEDLEGNVLQAARKAAERGIPIFTVGIGDPSGTTIPAEDNSGTIRFEGKPVMTRLMDQTLSAIAQASNGRYIPLGTAGTAHTTLGAIYRRHLSRIADREQQEMLENRYIERYQYFLIPAIILLLAAASLSRGRLSGTLKRRFINHTAVLLCCSLITLPLITGATESTATNETVSTSDASPDVPRENVTVKPGHAGARTAQSWLKKGEWTKAAEGFISAARGADIEEAERYRYNAAYAYYMGGDTTNACNTLRTLLSSRIVGARAGEFLGKINYETAQQSDNAPEPGERLKMLEESASSFQRAARELPSDERRNRNLTRAMTPLEELRVEAHIAEVLKEHANTPPDQLIGTMLSEQRDIIDHSYALHTNSAPQMIDKSESLAQRQKKNSDLWIPLKQALLQAVTNEQQQVILNQQIEVGRDSMLGIASALEDLLPEAGSEALRLEPLIYNFWKMTAAPNAIIDEDIICQSNTLATIDRRYLENRDSQPEALTLTTIFNERFPQWADQYIQQSQTDTNMPPFTAEDKAEIEELAAHVLKLQQEIIEEKMNDENAAPLRRQALRELLEIRKKLPRDNSSSNQQQQQQQQQEQQEQQQQEQQQEQQEQNEEQQEQQEQQQEQKEAPPEDVQELLRRALEREKEHEDEKKERLRSIPLPPNQRDW